MDLTGRWKALLANAQALIDWANEMRKKLSVAIADKDNFGVEDHLATCEVCLGALVWVVICVPINVDNHKNCINFYLRML